MSTPVEDLFRQASALDERDRANLAGLLLESLEDPIDEDIESAWRDEVGRRLADIDSGSVKLVPWEDVKAKLQKSVLSASSTGSTTKRSKSSQSPII